VGIIAEWFPEGGGRWAGDIGVAVDGGERRCTQRCSGCNF
jgi:hypothetical protein